MKRMVIASLGALLVGCATRPVSLEGATFVPADQAVALQSPVPEGGAVTVVRDAGGSPCLSGLFVDGDLVAKLGRSEKVRIYLPAGRATLSAHLVGRGLCGLELNKRGERATQIVISKGETQAFRIASDGNGTTTVTPVAE